MAGTAKSLTTLEIGAESPFVIPVSLKKIRQIQDVEFDSASPEGNPLKQVTVDLMTGTEVSSDERRKGIFRTKRIKSDKATWKDFAEVSAEDLAVIDDATKIESFTIDHFIPLKDVPFERITDAYFLAPAEGHSAKPLMLLARALKRTKRAGVFKLVKTSRQYLAVVYEQGGGLIVNTLAYAGDFAAYREAAESLDRADAKVAPQEVEMAAALVEALSADAEVIDSFEDELIPLRADLVERAIRGERLTASKRKAPQPVASDDLAEKLAASIKQVSASRRRAPVPA